MGSRSSLYTYHWCMLLPFVFQFSVYLLFARTRVIVGHPGHWTPSHVITGLLTRIVTKRESIGGGHERVRAAERDGRGWEMGGRFEVTAVGNYCALCANGRASSPLPPRPAEKRREQREVKGVRTDGHLRTELGTTHSNATSSRSTRFRRVYLVCSETRGGGTGNAMTGFERRREVTERKWRRWKASMRYEGEKRTASGRTKEDGRRAG